MSDTPPFLSTLPPGRGQRRLAAAIALVIVAAFIAVAPFASVPLAQLSVFVPIYQSATAICDLITAVLLLGQFAVLRSKALLALASGYLFTAFIAVAYMLTFPGLFAPSGLLGAGPQTTKWLYMFWHAVFPVAIIAYARLGDAGLRAAKPRDNPGMAVALSVAATFATACVLTTLATGGGVLPALMKDEGYTPAMTGVVGFATMLTIVALAALWQRKPHSVLDLWILVGLCAWLFDIALSVVHNASRFDVGFYAGRVYGLLASSLVLIALLVENGALYARLATALQGQRRGRELAETDAHETRQRLAGIIDSAMDAIITLDERQRIILFNTTAESLFGCPQNEALGASLDRFIPERFRASHPEHIRRFGEGGVVSRRMATQRVVTGVRGTGEEFPIEASISQVRLNGHKYYTVIVRDVTERARSDEALRRSKEELYEMATVSATAREQEKSRIARELHDELAQALTALRMDVDWLRQRQASSEGPSTAKLAAMERMLDRSVAATRRIASDLRPLMLDDLGLVPAAQWLVENFRERHGVECRIAIDPPDLELSDPQATAVFRIMQESLANVARHAGAAHVEVALTCSDNQIRLRVHDDGHGFDPGKPRNPNSFGLVGLRERAHLVDGVIRIDSAPGRGTSVEVRIPLTGAAA
jgi:PAS domain S-box-containing protein